MDLDSFQDEIGGISRYQIAIIVSICWICLGSGFSTQASIFISAVQEHRCNIPYIDDDPTQCNLTFKQIQNLTIPIEDDGDFSSCTSYVLNASYCTSACYLSCFEEYQSDETIRCTDGYVYDDSVYGETTTSQFNLVCDRRYLDTLAQTLFFFGFFIGSGLVGPLCDWAGRKTACLVLAIGYVSSSIGSAFSPSYEVYVVLRVAIGTCTISLFIAIFTYVCEISDTKNRTIVGAYANLISAIAHTVYAGIAYFVRNWRYLQFIIALVPLPMVVIYFLIPETPRWLFANEKYEEAKKVLSKYASSNKKELTDEDWQLILKYEHEKKILEIENQEVNKNIRVWDLFRRPLMRIMCFNIIFSWFTVSMVFYGLALNGGNLAGDPYLNNALNALVEIFANICVYFTSVFGRRPILIAGFVFSGIFCLASMLCELYAYNESGLLIASTAFAIIGKFFASNAFTVIYAVTSEIFPTNARATGMSLGSMAARVGSMLSPVVLQVQAYLPWFNQTLFGVLSIIAGSLSVFYPETNKRNFITSMDEAEEYYRNNIKIMKLFKKKQNDNFPTKQFDKKRSNNFSISLSRL